ncbi:MAG: hypothetical protein EXQ58_04555 [Acidobacteria bacterium]|nr:hypothetical protein [Acidobacteriota bacterium]
MDGSWGFSPGKEGAIEPTAYALMSLASEEPARGAIKRGVAFLLKTQTARRAWSVNTQDSEEAPSTRPPRLSIAPVANPCLSTSRLVLVGGVWAVIAFMLAPYAAHQASPDCAKTTPGLHG